METALLDLGGTGGFKEAKNDLIAELKLSHNVGGISKLKREQEKLREQHEREQYQRFLAKFTMENFLEKVPKVDPSGAEIPMWKREMMAKKAAETAKKSAIDRRTKEDELKKLYSVPEWKRSLIDKKTEDPDSNGPSNFTLTEGPKDEPVHPVRNGSNAAHLDNLVKVLQTKLQVMKEQNPTNNNMEEDEMDATIKKDSLKETIRKFSATSTPSTTFVDKKMKRSSTVETPSSGITINSEGKEEFCISFDQEPKPSAVLASLSKKPQLRVVRKPSRDYFDEQNVTSPTMTTTTTTTTDVKRFNNLQKVSEDEIALRIQSKVKQLRQDGNGMRGDEFNGVTKTPQSSRSSLVSSDGLQVQIESYDQQRQIGKIDTESADFSPMKERLESILSSHPNRSLSRPKSLVTSSDASSMNIMTVDVTTGTIVVDKTTKKTDSPPAMESPTSPSAPVPATRSSLKKKDSSEKDSDTKFVSVNPTVRRFQPIFKLSTFDDSTTDYAKIAKNKN